MAREEIGPVSGAASIAAILFIIVVALAGLGVAVVKALGGEEYNIPAKSKISLVQDATAAEDGKVKIPVDSIVYVEVSSGRMKPFPLSHAQTLRTGNPDDAKHILDAHGGQDVVLSAPAKMEVRGSSWGVFTIGMSIPIALLMGLWMYVLRKNARTRIAEASVIGVVLMLASVQIGSYVPGWPLGEWLNLSKHQVVAAMAIYGFVASVLPVWLLLCPRDYLSSYLKIGTISALVLGVLLVNPELKMPASVDWSCRPAAAPIFPDNCFRSSSSRSCAAQSPDSTRWSPAARRPK